jgi:hypothetical protein
MLQAPWVRPHIPLWIRNAFYKLNPRVPCRIVQLNRERWKWLVILANSFIWESLLVFIILVEDFNEFVYQCLDFGVLALILDASEWLVHAEIGYDVADESFYGC